MNFKKLLVAVSIIATATTANAALTTINGSALQNGLDAITQGGSFQDVINDQFNPDEIWSVSSTSGSINRLLFEFAGFENRAKFGIYDINNIGTTLQLFGGSSCGTADNSCTPGENFNTLRYFDEDDNGNSINGFTATMGASTFSGSSGPTTSKLFTSSNFGYYIDSGAGIFYSQKLLNDDLNDGGEADHMVTYKGDGTTMIDINGGDNYSVFSTGEYILAFEDLNFSNADKDYADFVVLVESVTSVPEPTTLAFMGLGLAGLGLARRKRKL